MLLCTTSSGCKTQLLTKKVFFPDKSSFFRPKKFLSWLFQAGKRRNFFTCLMKTSYERRNPDKVQWSTKA